MQALPAIRLNPSRREQPDRAPASATLRQWSEPSGREAQRLDPRLLRYRIGGWPEHLNTRPFGVRRFLSPRNVVRTETSGTTP
jgi:hypothetical protein